jgi:capsule synthesis protein PGA_cap
MNKNTTVQLLFGGDFAPCGAFEDLITKKGGEIFGEARVIIDRADFTMFNLEVPLCRDGTAIRKVGPAIRAVPETLRALEDVGVDAVCLANNHILDYGEAGLAATIAALEARGIRHAGAGAARESAEAPLRVEICGQRISVFSFAEREFNLSEDGEVGAALLDPLKMAPLLLLECDRADAIIVCIHGGNEYFPYPRPGLRAFCRFLIDVGADAVIGHHPHVPGPYELYRGKPIAYSLGNLIFDSRMPPPEWDEGYLAGLNLDFEGRTLKGLRLELFPYNQGIAQGGLQLMKGQEREVFLERIEGMRDRLENRSSEWLDAWAEFVSQRQAQSIIDLSSPLRFRGMRRLMSWRILRNLINPPSRQLHKLNLLRCASHRELVIHALERQLAADDKLHNDIGT